MICTNHRVVMISSETVFEGISIYVYPVLDIFTFKCFACGEKKELKCKIKPVKS